MLYPYIPFYFRGNPRSPEQDDLLKSILVGAHLDMDRVQELPRSIQDKRYRPELSNAEVIRLYPPHLLRQISGMFVRLLPVIPWPVQPNGSLGRTIQEMKQTFQNIDNDSVSAKSIIFLEQEDSLRALNVTHRSSSPRDWLRRTDVGVAFVIPLYDERKARSVVGSLSEFVEKSNNRLASVYASIAAPSTHPDALPPSSKRRG